MNHKINKLKSYSFLEVLFFSLLVSIISTHLFRSVFGSLNIQLTEILFLISILYFLFNIRKIRISQINKIDYSFIFLSLVLSINYLIHPENQVAKLIIASYYFISLYFIIRIISVNLSNEIFLKVTTLATESATWLLIFIGIFGFLLSLTNISDRFVLIYNNYPYFGDVVRIKGFSYSPNLYISILCFFTCILQFLNRLSLVKIALIFTIVILSLTKESAMLMAILVIFSTDKYFKEIRFKKLIFLFSGLIYLFFSLFYLSFKGNGNYFKNKDLLIDKPIDSFQSIDIYGTTYFAVSKSGFSIFKENWLYGIGMNNFQIKLSQLQKENKYPFKFELYRPTDSYFGIASELGVMYLVFLLILFYSIFNIVKNKNQVNIDPLILLLIYFLFESMCLGSFHFRHYYIFFAILPSLINFKNSEIKTKLFNVQPS